MRLYKAMMADGCSPYLQLNLREYLPHRLKDGEWLPGPWLPAVYGALQVGRPGNGYHAADIYGFVGWVRAHNYLVDVRGGLVGDEKELAARQMRLVQPVWLSPKRAHAFCTRCLDVAHHYAVANRRDLIPLYLDLKRTVDNPGATHQDVARHAARTALSIARGSASEPEQAMYVEYAAREQLAAYLESLLLPLASCG